MFLAKILVEENIQIDVGTVIGIAVDNESDIAYFNDFKQIHWLIIYLYFNIYKKKLFYLIFLLILLLIF